MLQMISSKLKKKNINRKWKKFKKLKIFVVKENFMVNSIWSLRNYSFIEIEMNKRNEHHRDTFFQRLQYHILRNIEIELTNIHIAFDDKTTKSYPFQFGLTIHSFLLQVFIHSSLLLFLILSFKENKWPMDSWRFKRWFKINLQSKSNWWKDKIIHFGI